MVMASHEIHTRRLTLRAASTALLDAELAGREPLAMALHAAIPSDWPPGEYDRDAIEFFRRQVEDGGEVVVPWYSWYAILRATQLAPATLVAAGGYFGPPDQAGEVEIGYSVATAFRGQGIASELVAALVANGFASNMVTCIAAHTTDVNPASLGVLRTCGFSEAPSAKPGYRRFELRRSAS